MSFLSPVCLTVLLSSYLSVLLGWIRVVRTARRRSLAETALGWFDVDQKELEGGKMVGREWWASEVVIPNNHVTSFRSLNAVYQIAWSFAGINLKQNFILFYSGWKRIISIIKPSNELLYGPMLWFQLCKSVTKWKNSRCKFYVFCPPPFPPPPVGIRIYETTARKHREIHFCFAWVCILHKGDLFLVKEGREVKVGHLFHLLPM